MFEFRLDITLKSFSMKIFTGKQRAKNDVKFSSGEKISHSKIFPKVFLFNIKQTIELNQRSVLIGCSILRCKIYREIERRKQKQSNGHDIDLIGYVDIPLSTITGNQFIEQWYPMQIPSGSIPTGKEKSQRLQDGSFNIRIKAKYQAIQILPIESYVHLQEVFISISQNQRKKNNNKTFCLVYSSRLSSINSNSRTAHQSSRQRRNRFVCFLVQKS